MKEFCRNKVNGLIAKIEDLCESEQYNIAFFGSDIETCFSKNFEYSKFSDEYSIFNFNEFDQVNTILIAGNVNHKELALIKAKMSNSEIKYLVHVPGSSLKRNNKFLYNTVTQLHEQLKFNIVFNQFPVDLAELTKKLRELKRGTHEH